MFSSEKKIEAINGLVQEVKHYLELQKEYAKLNTAEKGTIVAATLLIIMVCILLGGIALLLAMFAGAYYLGDLLNNLPAGFGIMAGSMLLLLLLFYMNRKRWITEPIARFMSRTLLTEQDGKP